MACPVCGNVDGDTIRFLGQDPDDSRVCRFKCLICKEIYEDTCKAGRYNVYGK